MRATNEPMRPEQRLWWRTALELKLGKCSGDAFQGFFSTVRAKCVSLRVLILLVALLPIATCYPPPVEPPRLSLDLHWPTPNTLPYGRRMIVYADGFFDQEMVRVTKQLDGTPSFDEDIRAVPASRGGTIVDESANRTCEGKTKTWTVFATGITSGWQTPKMQVCDCPAIDALPSPDETVKSNRGFFYDKDDKCNPPLPPPPPPPSPSTGLPQVLGSDGDRYR
jgi:hypothetical protein